MSRTKKGSKGPGYEFWSRRPTKFQFPEPGKTTKKNTHHMERKAARDAINQPEPHESKDPCQGCQQSASACHVCEFGGP